ncbi:MAG: hypothetical protein J6B08_00865 [Ruminiclostridium sp.]|nr:hypothetical protein [Ruminiclostridium sp.]
MTEAWFKKTSIGGIQGFLSGGKPFLDEGVVLLRLQRWISDFMDITPYVVIYDGLPREATGSPATQSEGSLIFLRLLRFLRELREGLCPLPRKPLKRLDLNFLCIIILSLLSE